MRARMAPRLPLESEAGTQSRASLRSCWLGTHDGHGGSGSVCTWWLKEAPMKIPFPPSSPDPGADGMLMGGICQLVYFPSTGMLSALLLLPKGLLPPQALGVLLPSCCSSAPPCATSFLPNVILMSSSSLVHARLLAGNCVPLGEGMGSRLEVCRTWVSLAHGHPRERGMRI